MVILLILLTLFDGISGLSKISKENTLKKEAQVAYSQGRYPEAITYLKTLADTLNVADEEVLLDLGHAYFKSNDLENASKAYQRAALATDKKLRSVAAQQLGVLSLKADNDKEKALAFFKEALHANPNNHEARYNYELLKKSKEENKDNKDQKNKDDKKQDKKDQDQKKEEDKKGEGNKDQKDQNKDGKGNKDKDKKGDKGDQKNGEDKDKKDGKGDKDNKDGKGDKKEDKDNKDKNGSDKDGDKQEKEEQAKGNKDKQGEKGQGKDDKKDGKEDEAGAASKEKQGGKQGKDKVVVNPEALAQMGMTEQKAKALLNAMRSNESQYIQQVKREPAKKSKKGKPDW